MLLAFEIFGCARNHGKRFLKLCQTCPSLAVSSIWNYERDDCQVNLIDFA